MSLPIDHIATGFLVRCTDGPAGIVERPIVSPRTGQFTHLVIERLRAPDTYWTVPAAEIAGVEPAAVRLTIDRAALNARRTYRRHQGEWLTADLSLPPVDFPERRDDPEVAADVLGVLRSDPIIAAGEVEVDADDGLIVLRGLVPTGLARLASQKLAEGVRGVCHVRNELLSDEEIAADVNRLLGDEVEFRRHHVRVLVDGGRVLWQHRDVPTELLARAAQIARGRPGVRSVETP
ncbi:MAG TPA: BON domain-containing protein [Dehalococcoidia bacterium]|nr:BON domain-containing protein [Dehalococcoidia bacterium]